MRRLGCVEASRCAAALVEEFHDRQRSADVALIREFAPQIPGRELVPLGEIIRGSLASLGLWRIDQPDIERADVIAAMRRFVLALVNFDRWPDRSAADQPRATLQICRC